MRFSEPPELFVHCRERTPVRFVKSCDPVLRGLHLMTRTEFVRNQRLQRIQDELLQLLALVNRTQCAGELHQVRAFRLIESCHIE